MYSPLVDIISVLHFCFDKFRELVVVLVAAMRTMGVHFFGYLCTVKVDISQIVFVCFCLSPLGNGNNNNTIVEVYDS